MMAQTNHDEFDDELLSAYVDGELTAAERAQVEERLRNDPAAAALVDELRSLSSTIKSLPREKLGRDLRAGVLAEGEQARADLERHGPATLPLEPVDRWQGIRRGFVWSALAIAATVAVAVFQPAEVEQEGRDLARAEKREAEVEQLDRSERQLRAIGDVGAPASTDKLSEKNFAADAEALPPGLRGSVSSGGVDGSVAAEGKEKELATLAASAPAPAAGAPLLTESAPLGEPMLEAAQQDAFAASAPAETALARDEAADLQANSNGESLQDLPAKPPAAMQTPLAAALPPGEAEAGGEPLATGGGGAFGPRGGAAFGIGGEAKSVEEAREGGQPAGAVGGMPTAKVTLKLASADGALRFKQLLAESDIAPADDAAAKKEMAGRRADRFAESSAFGRSTIDAKHDAEVQQERSLYFYSLDSTMPSADAADGAKFGSELKLALGVKQPAANAANLVWVEATPAQIDALLEKCRDDKAAFAAVLADDVLALAKPADGAAAEMKLKRLARVEQAPTEPKSEIAASEKRERVLFVLEPATPALQPVAPATAPPATIEAK